MKNILMKLFNYLFFLIFLYIIWNVLFHNNGQVWKYNPVIVISGVVMYLAVFVGIYNLFKNKKKTVNKNNIILLFAIVVFVQIIIGTIFQVEPAWDVKDLFQTAEDILKGNAMNPSYFYQYKNNLGMEVILLIIFKIADIIKWVSYYDLSMFVNIILIDLSIAITYLCAKKLYGQNKAVVVLLFLICMTPIYLYVPIIYTDTFTMFMPVLLYYLYLKSNEKETGKYKYYIFMAIILAIGILLKPTVAIMMVAIIISHFIYYKLKDSIVLIGTILPITSVLIILFNYFMPNIVFEKWNQEEYETKRFPVYNWLMMGLKGDGSYNTIDYMNLSRINGYEEKKQYALNEIGNRFEKVKKNGINQFLIGKTTYTWGEGTYFAQTVLKINPVRRGIVHEYILEKGKHRFVYQYFSQAQHVAMLILILLSVLNKKDENKNILKMSILGVFLFFLMWETRSRYLINYIPVMTLLSVEGIETILKGVEKLKLGIKTIRTKKK